MSGPDKAVTPQAIERCERLIRPYIRRTPVMTLDRSELDLPAGPLTLKLELLQHSGSFKARGAFTNLLTREIPKAGVVAASGGNHGAAVAYAAMRLKKPASIFVPSVSSPAKIARIRDYGADLHVGGNLYAEALAASEAWVQQTGALPVHAFDQNETIMGQGTLAIELEQQAPDIDTVLVSVGGGGLVAGVAAWYAGRVKVDRCRADDGADPDQSARSRTSPSMRKPAGWPRIRWRPAASASVFSRSRRNLRRAGFGVRRGDRRKRRKRYGATLRIVAEPGGACSIFRPSQSGAYRQAAGERVAVVISGGNTAAVNFG